MLIHPPHLGRRLLLSAAASLPFWGTSSAHAQSGSIRLGQTTSLSGPLSDIGVALQRGAMACFGAVNEFGGIHGQRIELISKDDAYDAQRGLANIESFLADPQLFGLFNCLWGDAKGCTYRFLVQNGQQTSSDLAGFGPDSLSFHGRFAHCFRVQVT